MPLDALGEVERDSGAVRRDVPGPGQIAHDPAAAVEAHQPLVDVVQQAGSDRGGGVGGGIQGGRLLDDPDDRLGLGGAGLVVGRAAAGAGGDQRASHGQAHTEYTETAERLAAAESAGQELVQLPDDASVALQFSVFHLASSRRSRG